MIRKFDAGVRCAAIVALSMGAMGVLGCGNDPLSAPSVPVAEATWKVQSSTHGLTLAVGDTFQLSTSALNLEQQPIAVSPQEYQYTSEDSTVIRVSPTGLITALKETQLFAPLHIFVSLTRGNVRVVDTVYAAVTTTRQDVASIKIQAPDSARTGIPGFIFLGVSAYDSNDFPLFGVYIWPHSNDPSFFVDPLFYYTFSFKTGTHWVYIEANAYGKELKDSLAIDILNAASAEFSLTSTLTGGISSNNEPDGITYYVQPCGSGMWTNSTTDTLDLTFDEPSHTGVCAPGDVTGNELHIAPGTTVIRKFPNAGETAWRIAKSSAPNAALIHGTISVQ